MYVTPFLKQVDTERKRADILSDGFLLPQFVFGSTEEDDTSWLEQAESIVQRKTKNLSRPDFDRQEENWLLLWDKLSSSQFDLHRLVPKFSALLKKFWGAEWFNKVILEQTYFQCFIVFSPEGELWVKCRVTS